VFSYLKILQQRRRQSTGTRGHGQFSGGTWRARGAQAYNGGLGAEPPAGSMGRAPGQEVRGAEAESFLALGRATDRANLYTLQYFQQSITMRQKGVK